MWVDVDAFERVAATACRSRDQAAHPAALDLYAGELLPTDRYEAWEERREGLRRLRLALLFELAGLYEEHGDLTSAMEAMQEVLADQRTDEKAHAGLMRLYALSGNKAQALAQYGRLERAISSELGADPPASSRALKDEIAAGHFQLSEARRSSSLPEKPISVGKHNLPAPRPASWVEGRSSSRSSARCL